MPAVAITPDDLTPFATIDAAKASEMVADALGMAKFLAPCIADEDFAYPDAAKSVIRGAILRWNDAGSGARSTQSAGPYSVGFDTTTPRRNMFWPSEIEQLQSMCKDSSSGGAFTVDNAGVGSSVIQHADVCTVNLGGQFCSCGAILTQGLPLWERQYGG